jgi:uncharacterized protein with ParB-like and HNH nuclease domain
MTDMLIKSEIMNINQLFDTNTYFIPKYQRNFAWENSNAVPYGKTLLRI